MESGKEVRGTTRSRSGPVRIGPRRQDVNATGHSRLVQRVCHSHRSWTKFRGPDRFFRGATGKSFDFKITRLSDTYEFSFKSSADTPGYTKEYVQEVDPWSGSVIDEYKATYLESEALEIKYIRRYGSLVDWQYKMNQ